MIAPHSVALSDEELAVVLDALAFFAAELPEAANMTDESAINRAGRIAEELCRRLPVAPVLGLAA